MSKNAFIIRSLFYNSLLKRNYCANNKKNTNPVLPIIAFGGGGGGGGGGSNIFMVLVSLLVARISHDNLIQNKK
jgi:hypothetical protein